MSVVSVSSLKRHASADLLSDSCPSIHHRRRFGNGWRPHLALRRQLLHRALQLPVNGVHSGAHTFGHLLHVDVGRRRHTRVPHHPLHVLHCALLLSQRCDRASDDLERELRYTRKKSRILQRLILPEPHSHCESRSTATGRLPSIVQNGFCRRRLQNFKLEPDQDKAASSS